MKPFKNILILVLVIVLLGGGLYAVMHFEPKQDEVITPELPQTVTVFKVDKASISAITVVNPEETYTLVNSGGNWFVKGEEAVKLSSSRVESFLYECANITGQNLITENAENLSQFGLSEPERTVELTLSGGEQRKILIGNAAFENSVSYLMVEGETKVYTKSTSGCEALTGALEKLMDTAIYSVDANDLSGITIERAGGETVVLDRKRVTPEGEEAAYQWMMLSPLHKEANTYRLENELFVNLLSQTAVRVIPVPEAGKDYGFQNPQAQYTIKLLDKKTAYTVTVGKEEGTNTFIRLAGNHSVFLVATEKLDFLNMGYLDLVDKLIHLENIKEVNKITVSGLGKEHVMEIKDGEEHYTIDGKTIKAELFKKAYQSVIGLVLDDFVKDQNSGGAVVLTVTYEKNDGSKNVVTCNSYDDRNYLVKVNGAGNLLIRKKQVDTMFATIADTLNQSN